MSDAKQGQLDLLGGLSPAAEPVSKSAGPASAARPASPAPAPPRSSRAIDVATSEAFPLERVVVAPRLEIALLPGQVGVSENGVRHARSVGADVERLAGAALVVDLTTAAERGELGVADLHARLEKAGLRVLPVPTAPGEAPEVDVLDRAVAAVRAAREAGEIVVVVSRRGLGRAGTFAAAVLVSEGASETEVLASVRALRGREAVGSDAQLAAVRGVAERITAVRAAAPSEASAPERSEDEADDREAYDFDDAEPDDEESSEGAAEPDDEDDDGPRRAPSDALRWVAPLPAAPSDALTPRTSMFVGCVLGGAIGDAMGHPTEFLGMAEIRRRWGPHGVTRFELHWDRGGKRFAPYTDDTQMAEAVLVSLLESRDEAEDLDAAMRRMAGHFVRWSEHPQGGHRAPGNACLTGCRALARGARWSEAGGATAGGCGSVMRAYPFGLLFADDLRRAEDWAVAHSKLTHRDPIALAASAAMAVGVARVVRGDPDDVVLSEMIAAACRQSPKTAGMMAQALEEARDGVGPDVTLDRNRGWAAHEAIAAAVYVVARHPRDARAAILEGANTPGDSDSIATLAGALVGARVGLGGLPAEWVEEVERSAELAALGRRIG